MNSNKLELTLELVRDYANNDLKHFTDIVRTAFTNVDPVFLRPRYDKFFWHCAGSVPGWMAQVVLANADAESDGSNKLLKLWQSVNYNEFIEEKVLFHARDEARHSRLFVKLARMAFPSLIGKKDANAKKDSLVRIKKDMLIKSEFIVNELTLIDHLVQMNMGEIRTRLHMELLGPAIHAFSPENSKSKVKAILNGLSHDAVVHISYIASLIESWCETGDKKQLLILYRNRLQDFHEFTIRQTESAVNSYGAGRFPDLLEI